MAAQSRRGLPSPFPDMNDNIRGRQWVRYEPVWLDDAIF